MSRPARIVLSGALVAALCGIGGCMQPERGFSGRAAELARQRTPAYAFLEEGPERAVLLARGVALVLAPVEGLCLTRGSFSASRSGAFAVIADCVTEAAVVSPVAEGSALDLPPSFPGLVTIAISGAPARREGGAEAQLAELESLLGAGEGLEMLGRNGDGGTVELVEMVRGDGASAALYVHVRDSHKGGLALLAPDFWRGFVEIRGRLVLVTVSGFRDRPIDEGEMMDLLRRQVARLRSVNAGPEPDVETLLAAAGAAPEDPGAQAVAEAPAVAGARGDAAAAGDGLRDLDGLEVVVVERGAGDEPERLQADQTSSDGGTAQAPEQAPPPPVRRFVAATTPTRPPGAVPFAPPRPKRG
ncbi:MAG: hypothetical protein ACFBRM_11705 [Pikeienuella sp.]